MEYCPGGTLKDMISQNEFISEAEIFDFLKQFINGYEALYYKKIIHRDIKPENILISDNKYKIGDFGLSKLIQFENMKISAKG